MTTNTLPKYHTSTGEALDSLEGLLSQQTGMTKGFLEALARQDNLLKITKASLKQARTDKDKGQIESFINLRTQSEATIKGIKAEISGSKYLSMLTVEHLTKLYDFNDYNAGINREYDGETLGNAVKVGSYAEDSPEWHKARSNGTGGSDVAIIMGVSPFKTREALIALKTGETVQKANNSGGAALRGHIWENYIARKFATKNPDKKVLFTKDSWHKSGDEKHRANFDGLICENGSTVPNAILEIKTASKLDDWKLGVPEYYRLQVLWYMDACGFTKGYVAVMFNDNEYSEYEVIAKEGEMEAIHKEVAIFNAEVEARKVELALAA